MDIWFAFAFVCNVQGGAKPFRQKSIVAHFYCNSCTFLRVRRCYEMLEPFGSPHDEKKAEHTCCNALCTFKVCIWKIDGLKLLNWFFIILKSPFKTGEKYTKKIYLRSLFIYTALARLFSFSKEKILQQLLFLIIWNEANQKSSTKRRGQRNTYVCLYVCVCESIVNESQSCERMPTDTIDDALHVLWKHAMKGMAQTKNKCSKERKKNKTNAAHSQVQKYARKIIQISLMCKPGNWTLLWGHNFKPFVT